MLQRSEHEQQVFAALAEGSEGTVLLGYLRRLVAHVTDARQIKEQGGDMNIAIEAAARAAGIIEENLIEPLSRVQHHQGEHEPMD
jgi:hypothetical protein